MSLQIYSGIDPIASPPVTAGKGVWATIKIPSDGDDRSAASINTGIQGLTNRTNWLAQHMVNGVDGGTYSGPLQLTQVQLLANQDAMSVPHPIIVASPIDATGYDLAADDINCDNVIAGTLVTAPTINGVVGIFSGDVSVGGNETVAGNLTVLGYQPIRVASAPDANHAYTAPQDVDLINIPAALTADRTYTLGTGGPNNVPITFRRPAGSGIYVANIADGSGTLASIGSLTGFAQSVTLIKLSGAWTVLSYCGDLGVIGGILIFV